MKKNLLKLCCKGFDFISTYLRCINYEIYMNHLHSFYLSKVTNVNYNETICLKVFILNTFVFQ